MASAGLADDRTVRLAVPPVLAESGLLPFILPRFSLKTQIRVEPVAPGAEAELALGAVGRPLFVGDGATWSLEVLAPDHPGAQRFVDWLGSDVGQNTISMFKRDGEQVFTLAKTDEDVEIDITFEGDAILGQELSLIHCGRCHVSAKGQLSQGIGSTPSFFVLRTLPDWDLRFQTFYVLNPHPAFTQIDDVTDPFPEDRPSPIVPVEMTLDDLDAILAYVAALEPADLGAPLQHQ